MKMNKHFSIKFFSALALLLVAFLHGCQTPSSVSNNNLSEIYRRSDQFLEPEFVIYHVSDSESEVHFKINTANLLYTKAANSNYEGKVRLSYQIFKDFDSNELIDSSSTVFTDTKASKEIKDVIGSFKVKLSFPNSYVLKIKSTDIKRDQSTNTVIPIDKSTRNSRHDFLVKNLKTGTTLFRKHINSSDSLLVDYSSTEPYNQVTVKYYNRYFPVAPPPFVNYSAKPFDYKPDSTFTVQLSDSGTFIFKPSEEGFYHIQTDTSDMNGLTLFYFDDEYPVINTVPELVSATRFITSKKEYTNLSEAEDQKKAIDDFWLTISRNPDRARELVRTYYNRVENANFYFSSYKEGWKTDRGIIYMVFGPPNSVYKSNNAESWIYGEESNYSAVSFNFNKVNNPFTDNDFILERTPAYKTHWYRAVDAWRQGRVSTLDF